MAVPEKFENVTAVCKANVYFDGKVVSHTLLFADGTKKTIGLIYPGSYHQCLSTDHFNEGLDTAPHLL